MQFEGGRDLDSYLDIVSIGPSFDSVCDIRCLILLLCSVALGYQHSIANFFLVPIGMFYGTNFGVGKFIYQCVIPVTLGNIVGGALFTGVFLWFLYGRDTTLAVETGQPLSGEKKADTGARSQRWGGGRSRGQSSDQADERVTAGENRDGSARRRVGGNIV